jgi:hypothetical protein
MPKTIEAVRCENCNQLIPSTDYFVTLHNISVTDKAKARYNEPYFARKLAEVKEETTFCSINHLASWLLDQHKAKTGR